MPSGIAFATGAHGGNYSGVAAGVRAKGAEEGGKIRER